MSLNYIDEEPQSPGIYNNKYFPKNNQQKSRFLQISTKASFEDACVRKQEDYFSDMEEEDDMYVKPIILYSLRYKIKRSIINCR